MIATTVAAALAILTPPTQDVLTSTPVAYSSSQNGVISGQDMALFQQGLASARARDVIGTQSVMTRISDPTARKLVEWALVDTSDKQLSYADLARAQTDLANWPRGDSRRAAGERALNLANASPDAVIAFFNGSEPTTAEGAIALASALEQKGQRREAQALIRDWWRTRSFEEAQQSVIANRWGGWLNADDHVTRLNMLLLGPHGP
ncbi:MAG: lytic transglycosylase domain-containing protein, partial [Brevundimonas sp.]